MTSSPSVVITGCSEPLSIGTALARAYLKRGYTVFATARNVSSMTALGEAGCHLIALDVVDPESIANAVKQVSDVTGGRLNILVNNVSAYMSVGRSGAQITLLAFRQALRAERPC